MRIFYLLGLLCLASAASLEAGIVGDGHTIEASVEMGRRHPAVVSIRCFTDRGAGQATGVLIAPDVVLTAAHIFHESQFVAIEFNCDHDEVFGSSKDVAECDVLPRSSRTASSAGAAADAGVFSAPTGIAGYDSPPSDPASAKGTFYYFSDPGKTFIHPEAIYTHPKFSGLLGERGITDLGFIVLERPVSGIEPVELSSIPAEIGEIYQTVGYGFSGTSSHGLDPALPRELRAGTLGIEEVTEHEIMSVTYEETYAPGAVERALRSQGAIEVSPSSISWAREMGPFPIFVQKGDGGCPLFKADDTLVGIHSRTIRHVSSDTTANVQSVFTPIAPYLKWINSLMIARADLRLGVD